MIASAASVASAAGLGCLAAVWGAWLQIGLASGRAGWQLSADRGCLLQIGLASGKAGGFLLSAISAGLIHENQPTVCKGNAFSWNRYQK